MFGRLLVLLMLVIALAGGYVWWVVRDLPSVDTMMAERGDQLPVKTTQVMAADGTVILSEGQFRHRYVKYSDVSPYFIKSLLATEDRRFFDHHGVDPVAMVRALGRNLTNGKLLEGGSTLTQQLVRNLFLSNERSLSRKIREMVLSFQIEGKLSKEQILELYINNIYFGEGAYGIAAASEIFFGKRPANLTVEEAALLAGLPQAPTLYSPYANKDKAKNRRNEVIQNLVEAGLLEADQARFIQEKPIKLNPAGRNLASGNKAPYFNQFVMAQAQSMFDLNEQAFWQSGFRIYTTLDTRAQRLAEDAVVNGAKQFGFSKAGQELAALSINPKTGAILAYVGGRSFSESQFDRVSQAMRSPGSLFKIFTYTAALEKGFKPNRVYLDEPVAFGSWAPKNYDGQHHGYMTMAQALALSNNIVAVKVIQEVTPAAVSDVARRMGIHSTLDESLALTLGGSGVNMIEITSAFATLANRGVRSQPYVISRITDSQGRLLYMHQPRKQDVLHPEVADTMVSLLQGVILHGTGKGANIGRPMAGKTGTSDDNRDAWFIGFTPELVTAVWAGQDNNTPMPKSIVGGSLPANVWKRYMAQYLAGTVPNDFLLVKSLEVPDEIFTSYKIEDLSNGEQYDPNKAQSQEGQPEVDPETGLPIGGGQGEGQDTMGIRTQGGNTLQGQTNPGQTPSNGFGASSDPYGYPAPQNAPTAPTPPPTPSEGANGAPRQPAAPSYGYQ